MIDQPCVIRDYSDYLFVSVKYVELVRMSRPKLLRVYSRCCSALGEVTVAQGSFVAATAHKAECQLWEHERDGDQPAHEQSHNYAD